MVTNITGNVIQLDKVDLNDLPLDTHQLGFSLGLEGMLNTSSAHSLRIEPCVSYFLSSGENLLNIFRTELLIGFSF